MLDRIRLIMMSFMMMWYYMNLVNLFDEMNFSSYVMEMQVMMREIMVVRIVGF